MDSDEKLNLKNLIKQYKILNILKFIITFVIIETIIISLIFLKINILYIIVLAILLVISLIFMNKYKKKIYKKYTQLLMNKYLDVFNDNVNDLKYTENNIKGFIDDKSFCKENNKSKYILQLANEKNSNLIICNKSLKDNISLKIPTMGLSNGIFNSYFDVYYDNKEFADSLLDSQFIASVSSLISQDYKDVIIYVKDNSLIIEFINENIDYNLIDNIDGLIDEKYINRFEEFIEEQKEELKKIIMINNSLN